MFKYIKIKEHDKRFYKKFRNLKDSYPSWKRLFTYVYSIADKTPELKEHLTFISDKYYFRLSESERKEIENTWKNITNYLIKISITTYTLSDWFDIIQCFKKYN